MAATFNPQAAADQARNAFTVIVLGAIFVLATAHVAASDPPQPTIAAIAA